MWYEVPPQTKVRLFPVMLVLAVVLMATGRFDPVSLASQPAGGSAAAKAVAYAKRQVGKSYRWGATGPDAYDCSGLTQAAWRAAGVSIPRTAQGQLTGLPRASGQLRSGDLLIYASNGPSRRHVAMVVGPGLMAEALGSGIPVRVTRLRPGYLGAVRPRPPAPPVAAAPSRAAPAGIPPTYATLYHQAGGDERWCTTGGDCYPAWSILAGIGARESGHGQSQAAGVHSGVNFAGCCAGPMQFNLRDGPPSTWQQYGRGNVYDPRDAIPAAARKLRGQGARGDLDHALLRYNNDWTYVQGVKQQARTYQG